MSAWVGLLLRTRRLWVGFWLITTALGVLAAGKIGPHLSTSVDIPGTQSAQASALLAEKFGQNIEGTFTIIYRFNKASELPKLKASIELASQKIPKAKVVQQNAMGGFLITSIQTPYKLNESSSFTESFRSELKQNGIANAFITGPPAINHDVQPVLAHDLRKGEIIALCSALLILFWLFGRTRYVFVPLLFALGTVSLSIGIIYLLALKFMMVLYIPNIVELIGLGLAIDYSLLSVHRYRMSKSIAQTLSSAGRTIAVSATMAICGLAMLLLIPVPFIRSLGLAGIVVPLVTLFGSYTLQPILLSFMSQPSGEMHIERKNWIHKWSTRVVNQPKRYAITSLLLLVLISYGATQISLTPSSFKKIPANMESAQGLKLITDRVGLGVITPIELIFNFRSPGQVRSEDGEQSRQQIINHLSSLPETFIVGSDTSSLFVDPQSQYLRIYLVAQHEMGAKESQALVQQLRSDPFWQQLNPRPLLKIGGGPAQGVDLIDALKKSMPKAILLIALAMLLIMARAFKSIVIPVQSIAFSIISLCCALGALNWIMTHEVSANLFGIYQQSQLEAWALIFIVGVLFGLSMDYEIFIVSRIREAKLKGDSNRDAIISGLTHTGSVVSGAALILIAALIGLSFSEIAGLQQVGLGLAIGIAIDATLIRFVLLPSVMSILGKWNWWIFQSITSAEPHYQ